uniref:hypothetical protein n=1 Tax=uncultured Alistipes sp. TaxID=538949 RepID=UPI0027356399
AGPDKTGSEAFYPAAGYRDSATGALGAVGTYGYAWSSSSRLAGDSSAGNLNFYSGNVSPLSWGSRAHGFPVRCVRN